ncbi:protein FAM13B isoform X1 [Sebastes umbrosus]|uniref:protein FAM13B isoform X1 n=1 Tax=Sebastes umbrosus TaxID=72105 RepID=UPI00189D8016|nr:protein FAM13B isoform X1 [Sebastes umbrosus]XP_037635875.1 protein FAM13B isoform X1 [Sebastes umbrosus]XP_037635876.1 protein FAM13B isoform X1 [Sebastes umbrosus]
MRKSVSPLPGNEGGSSASTTRVFGVPLEEVTRTHTISGHEVPALVKHIVDYIEEHGHLDLEGLFLVNGNAERVDWLRQRYDSGEEVELEKEADLASAVSLLRLFLQELPEPVIPTAIQGHILQLHQDYSNEEDLCRNLKYLLQQLPQLNYGLLRFLCRFLASVASLQQESWNIGTLAAVFGPDIFHLSTEGEDLRDQESVSRVLAELLDNQDGLFDSEEDDVSTTNDYSSINEQITELLDDEKCEAECEELPQDGEEGLASSDSPQHTLTDESPTASSHLSPISILPADSAEIIHRTIRAAVEQHFFDLKTSIDQDLSNYDSQGVSPSESADQGCHGDEEQQTDPEDSPCDTEGETPLTQTEQHIQQSQTDTQDSLDSGATLEESSGMDLDAEAVRDAENNINTARQDNQPCDNMEQTDTISCDSTSCRCDQNANTSKTNRNHLSPCQPNSGHKPHLQLFPDSQWEASPPSHLHLPPIDFSCMHLQKEGQDPVPAFKSWQDDSESGEAQLSPLAGRMVSLPPLLLEEDGEEDEGEGGQEASPSSSRSHPHLLARRFLDFGAHGAQRFLQQDPDATSPTKAQRPRRASFGSKEAMRGGDSVTHQLTKKLQHLKKKIKQFEEQFEKERNYKPSHGDKAANPKVLKWMTDLTKIRRQIKGRQHHLLPRSTLRHQALLHSYRRHHAPSFPSSSSSSSICSPPHHTLTPPLHPYSGLSSRPYHLNAKHRAESELGPQTRPRSNTLPKSFGSTLDQGAYDAAVEVKGQHPTREETLELIQHRVKGKKQEDGWPDDIKKMTKEQLSCEKTVLQKNLLHYEGLHGRPVTREERLVVKPLYDRYRLVKQMLTRVSITPITVSPSSKRRSQTLQPIIEGETAHFWEEIKEEEEDERKEREEGGEEEEEEERGAVEEERDEEEEEEDEEEEGESSGGEMQSSEVIMAVDLVTSSEGSVRSQNNPDRQGDCPMRAKMEEGSGKLALDLRLSSSNASSMPELLEQLWKARAEKKKLRKTIREFEEDFYQHNGRNVQKEDRVPMLEEYREYKRIKAKLRLLEVLISKQDSSKSI